MADRAHSDGVEVRALGLQLDGSKVLEVEVQEAVACKSSGTGHSEIYFLPAVAYPADIFILCGFELVTLIGNIEPMNPPQYSSFDRNGILHHPIRLTDQSTTMIHIAHIPLKMQPINRSI